MLRQKRGVSRLKENQVQSMNLTKFLSQKRKEAEKTEEKERKFIR